MLFFQVVLLAGYSYAFLITSRFKVRHQVIWHLAVLALSLLFLRILPGGTWKPTGTEPPTQHLLLLLTIHIGLPFAILSSTGPLLSFWFSRMYPGRSPYRLYALSNFGSLLALASYPFVVEPIMVLQTQALLWTWGYRLFVVVCAWCAWQFLRTDDSVRATSSKLPDPAVKSSTATESSGKVRKGDRLLWLVLAGTGSTMLLATTNRICQDLAVVPLLWVLPLAVYLVTFILCFDNDWLYSRRVFGTLLAFSAAAVAYVVHHDELSLWTKIGVYATTLFACCMTCHGELARSKPGSWHLTRFYLSVAAGGALGGVLVAIVAPRVFKDYWEYPLGLIATILLAMFCVYRDGLSARATEMMWSPVRRRLAWGGAVVLFIFVTGGLIGHAVERLTDSVETTRNFFGVIRIQKSGSLRKMLHGRVIHGSQIIADDSRYVPTTYFGWDSGVGLAIRQYHRHREQGLRIGVIGLGAGTISALAEQGDALRYYEINPDVARLARRYFTYLDETAADVDVVIGDARLILEQEAERGEHQQFDVLVLDAFDSDAIPLHLLTREAYELYRSHLVEDGLLAVHVSNLYVDITPIVRGLAQLAGHRAIHVVSDANDKWHARVARWVLVTNNESFLAAKAVEVAATPWIDQDPPPFVWTDASASLWSVVGRPRSPSKWESAPNRGRFVIDNARLISYADEQDIQEVCRTLYHDTAGENPILVVTVQSTSEAGGGKLSFASFTKRVSRQTGMFKAQADTGVMILLALENRRLATLVGAGWSREFSAAIDRVGEETLRAGLASGRPSTGLVNCVRAIDQVIRQSASPNR